MAFSIPILCAYVIIFFKFWGFFCLDDVLQSSVLIIDESNSLESAKTIFYVLSKSKGCSFAGDSLKGRIPHREAESLKNVFSSRPKAKRVKSHAMGFRRPHSHQEATAPG